MTPEERFEAWRKSVSKGGTACIGLTENLALRRAYLAGYQAGAEDMREMVPTPAAKAPELCPVCDDRGCPTCRVAAWPQWKKDAHKTFGSSEHSEEKSDGN